jgi:predicted deacylase
MMAPLSGFREARDATARRSALAAAAFGLEIFWMMSWAPGTLSTALNQLGISAVACELGGLGVAALPDVPRYLDGIIRCLRHAGVLEPPLVVELPPTVRTMDPIPSPWSGLVDLAVDLRQSVRPGDLLARVLDPWGSVQGDIVAPFDAIVLHKRLFRMVRVGETVVSLGRLVGNPVSA